MNISMGHYKLRLQPTLQVCGQHHRFDHDIVLLHKSRVKETSMFLTNGKQGRSGCSQHTEHIYHAIYSMTGESVIEDMPKVDQVSLP